jgi:hypothetical protein
METLLHFTSPPRATADRRSLWLLSHGLSAAYAKLFGDGICAMSAGLFVWTTRVSGPNRFELPLYVDNSFVG